MKQDFDCQQITNTVEIIRIKRRDFDKKLSEGNIDSCLQLKFELSEIIKETNQRVWSLEILSRNEIEKQYKEWEELYENLSDLGEEYKLPSLERVMEFMRSDPEFMKLMKIKEKQGFTKLNISPAPGYYSLGKFCDAIGSQVKLAGGKDTDISPSVWNTILERESMIHYFGKIHEGDDGTTMPLGGVNAREIMNDPEKYSICDGWMISFTTDEQNIPETPKTVGDRITIKTNLTALDYEKTYFTDKIKSYEGEKAMIPQEYLALFAESIFEKYIKTGKKVEQRHADVLGNRSSTLFISTHLPKHTEFLYMGWTNENLRIIIDEMSTDYNTVYHGVRASVRKRINK